MLVGELREKIQPLRLHDYLPFPAFGSSKARFSAWFEWFHALANSRIPFIDVTDGDLVHSIIEFFDGFSPQQMRDDPILPRH